MEPRARASRHKSSLNFSTELSTLLFAAGAPTHPDIIRPQNEFAETSNSISASGATNKHLSSTTYLSTLPTPNKDHTATSFSQPFPETLRVLDEIITDFIIETSHSAVMVASYSGRTKLKLSDFEWVVRKDAMKLGRVHEMFRKEKQIKTSRKIFNEAAGSGKLAVGDMIDLGNVAGEEGTGKGKGRGRGRRKKRGIEEVDGSGAGGGAGGVAGAGAGNGDSSVANWVNGGGNKDGSSAFDDDIDIDVDDDVFGEIEESRSKKARSEVG